MSDINFEVRKINAASDDDNFMILPQDMLKTFFRFQALDKFFE